jgi:hypothetical protein
MTVLPEEGYRPLADGPLRAGSGAGAGAGDNASPQYAAGVNSGSKGGEVNQPRALQQGDVRHDHIYRLLGEGTDPLVPGASSYPGNY